jgi:hypothetical protein
MSERPVNEIPFVATTDTVDPEADQRALAETRAQKKARVANILDRGQLLSRLAVELPTDLHGEWVRNDALEITRLKTLGFEIDTVYAPKRSIHSNGDDGGTVGDVIFMTCPRETMDLIEEIRADALRTTHGDAKSSNLQTKEEKDFRAGVGAETGGEIPTFSESKTTRVGREQIQAAILADMQTQPSR